MSTYEQGQELTTLTESVFTTTGGAKLHYVDFVPSGEQSTVPLLCLHGFVRSSLDFADLGAEFARRGTRVISPDLRGRGLSQRYENVEDYHFDLLVKDVIDLMDHLNLKQVVVLGIALGAMIGMTLVTAQPGRIRGLILNDTGAEVGEAGVKNSQDFMDAREFTLDEAVARMKSQYADIYRNFDESRWPAITRRVYREVSPGRFARDFDMLAMGDAMRMRAESTKEQLWPLFLSTKGTPIALLRGEISGFLSQEVAERMVQLHPNTLLTVVKDRGHPPLLDEPESIEAIQSILKLATNSI